jgi:hypothetical protein
MKTAWVRKGGSLRPASESATEWLSKLSENQNVMGDLRRVGPRNIRQFRLFFVLAHILHEHGLFPSDKAAQEGLKIAAGCFHMIELPNPPEILLVPDSIAWENFDEDKFVQFFKACVHVICTRLLPGTNDEDLKRIVFEIVDGPQRTSLGRRA